MRFPYTRYFLDNGLEVIIHPDPYSKIAVFNLLYKVGSRNESPGKTGLAHFFEHLMFGSSKNVPVFDRALERVGGSCNAFTSPDITNYYMSLPVSNLETAFWLESDRMLQLTLAEKTIETQRKVVLEEFKQRYLNQPYGDIWHLLRPLAFQSHPYRWPTIGATLHDIEGYTAEDITQFYRKNYAPNHAILVVAGDVKAADVMHLAEKWFGPIPPTDQQREGIAEESEQLAARVKIHTGAVPVDMLYKTYKMPGKGQAGYLEADLISDILGFGKSSLLEQELVQKGKEFASVGAFILGSQDPGLLVFTGKMESGVSSQEAEGKLDAVIEGFLQEGVDEQTLQKTKNQGEAIKTYESIQLINRAMNLAFYANLGHPDLYWDEFEKKSGILSEHLMDWAHQLIRPEKSTVLHYQTQAS